MIDPRSAQAIATLLPKVQPRFKAFYEAANDAMKAHGLTVRFISGTRSYSEQEALYAQGRTKPGNKVTNARAGYSWHNWGLAVDVGIFKGKTYLAESQFYSKLWSFAEDCGLEWGGKWKIPDRPHYQFRPDNLKGLPDSKCFPILIGLMKEGKNALGETAIS